MDGKYADEVWGYVDAVISGARPACKELKQTCKRFADDYASGRWDYSTTEADYVIDKIQTQFVHRRRTNPPAAGGFLLPIPPCGLYHLFSQQRYGKSP